MAEVAGTQTVYADEDDAFSEEFAEKLRQQEGLDTDRLTDSEFDCSEYSLVLISDRMEGWQKTIESGTDEETHIIVLSSSPGTLATAVDLGADDCLRREDAPFQVERLVKQLSGDLSGISQVGRKEREGEMELYEAMIESIPEPVWAIDKDGYFIFANDSYEFGLQPEDIVGTHIKRWMTDDGFQRIQREIFELLASDEKESHSGEYQLEAFGMSRIFNVYLSLIDPDTTDLAGTVGMLRDLTKQKEREQRLNVLNRVFRHNIRNSLTIIKGRAEVVGERGADADREHAEQIIGEANRLEELSEKAKDAGKILNRKPDRRSREVAGIVSGVVELYDDREAEIQFSAPERADAYVIDGLRFAIDNLVENAIEHNESEGLIVEVDVEQRDEFVSITVSDNGTGISESELAAIRQGEEEDLVHGSGLGLWVVNWIVQRSTGELTFRESESGGAEIEIELSQRV